MWSGEWSIRQSEDGDNHEEDEDTDQASEDVVVPVTVISGEGCVGEGQDTYQHQADGVGLVEKSCNYINRLFCYLSCSSFYLHLQPQ